MTTQISGDTGVSQCQPNSVSQDDLQANVVGKGPAFSVSSTSTTVAVSTEVTVDFNAKAFDTDNNFNLSTDTFTATVAGYYQVNALVTGGVSTSAGSVQAIIVKNGSTLIQGLLYSDAAFTPRTVVSTVVSLDVGDTLGLRGRNTMGANLGSAEFSASLVRAA